MQAAAKPATIENEVEVRFSIAKLAVTASINA
jgi:hypothetical protein